MKTQKSYFFTAWLICIILSACEPPQAELAATATKIVGDNFVTQTTQPPTSTPTIVPYQTMTPTLTAIVTLTPNPLKPLVLVDQNLTLMIPPDWEELSQKTDATILGKINSTIVMVITRSIEKSPTDLIVHSKNLVGIISKQNNLKNYEVNLGESLSLANGLEVRAVKFTFPNDILKKSGKDHGKTTLWYFYVHDGISAYIFTVLGGADDMTLAQAEIEGVITSALLKVSFDNVHLAFAMMPGWQLQKSDNDWVSIWSLDRKGLVIASLTIMRLDNGKSPKDLAANSPHLVAVTATTIVQYVFGFDATFEPDHTLKLANGVEAYSAYATENIKGMEQEFLYIDIETTKQGTIILFNSPAGYIAKNRASLEAFLATIELTAK